MAALLEIREQLRGIYSRYDMWIEPILKFALAFITLIIINTNLGYMTRLGNPAIILVAALLCSFLPVNVLVLIAAAFCMLHTYALSLECAAVLILAFMLMFLMYFRFAPSDALVLIFTPVCFLLHIPYVVPVACGLLCTPLSAVSVGCGVAAYYIIDYIKVNASALGNLQADSTVQKFKYVIDGLLNNKAMMVMIVAFAVTVVLVYILKRLPIDHSWMAAIVTGLIACDIIKLVGDVSTGVNESLIDVILGSIISFVLLVGLQFFVFSVDYTRSESLQFEDDEYYYYVKAIPKMTVAVSEKKVKHISSQKNNASRERINRGGSAKTAASKSIDDYPVFAQPGFDSADDGYVRTAPVRRTQQATVSRSQAARDGVRTDYPARDRRAAQSQASRRPQSAAPSRSSAGAGTSSRVAQAARAAGNAQRAGGISRAVGDTPVRTAAGGGAQRANEAASRNSRPASRPYSAARTPSSSMAAPRRTPERMRSLTDTERINKISSPTQSFMGNIED